VGDKQVFDASIDLLKRAMQGPLMTSVQLTVVRPSTGQTLMMEVLRHEPDDGDVNGPTDRHHAPTYTRTHTYTLACCAHVCARVYMCNLYVCGCVDVGVDGADIHKIYSIRRWDACMHVGA
jgi:hypothetical protein